jgi:hypothetical protein
VEAHSSSDRRETVLEAHRRLLRGRLRDLDFDVFQIILSAVPVSLQLFSLFLVERRFNQLSISLSVSPKKLVYQKE